MFTVASAMIYVEERRLVQLFPESVEKVWNEWELRILLLISLTLQIILILLGNRRRRIGKTWIRITLWSAYLMADWVATVALSVISKNIQDKCNKHGVENELISFWAPFVLLHLGGPDTITAYALEDNELWLRHLAGLVIQTGMAVYIFLISWPGSSAFPIMSIPIFVAGLIKYIERTLALRSANTEHFRDSILTPPDPGPNYAKFMEEFTLKKAEGFLVTTDEVIEPPVPLTDHSYPAGQGKLISEAYDLFQTFKLLFVDLILSFQDGDRSKSYFQNLTPDEVFRVIEVELGFAFDVFYTKAPVVYNVGGCIIRLCSLLVSFAVLMGLVLLTDSIKYHEIDLIITLLLLVVAILLEIYAVIVVLKSDWMDHWLSKHNKTRDVLIFPFLRQQQKLRWSNSMAQYNLLSFCLGDKPAVCHGVQRLLRIDKFREKHRYKTYNKVSKELKKIIFERFKKFTESTNDLTALCTHKGSFALKENDCESLLDWSTKGEFDQSILTWHIATDICYYLDRYGDNRGCNPDNISTSKNISDYMLYLLVMCPFMLPIGIGMIRFCDTCAEAREFFKERGPIKNKTIACKKLLQVNTEVVPAKVKGDRSKSVLFDACRIAKSLRAMEKEHRWKTVCYMWVDMLAYAATHCRGNHHAQQLRKGGELLTHVWLLMAHLGITEQFQINQGHARAKLIVK